MRREIFIENNIIRNREKALGIRDALFIRRCRVGRGFGVADLVLLPSRGPYRMIIVEAKLGGSIDSKINVVGQLLMYYAGALRLGTRGVRMMRQFATSQSRAARSLRPKSLKRLCGGITPPDLAWAELCKGRRLLPNQIALYVGLDCLPSLALTSALSELATHHALRVGVVSVLARDQLKVWNPEGSK
jgi:hypothetical protein